MLAGQADHGRHQDISGMCGVRAAQMPARRPLAGSGRRLVSHVPSKADLLDGLVDLVFSEIELPSGTTGWRTAMRERAIAIRAVLSRHRWAIGLMESRTSPG